MSKRNTLNRKTGKLEVNVLRKISHANANQKKSEVSIFISDKAMNIIKDKESIIKL